MHQIHENSPQILYDHHSLVLATQNLSSLPVKNLLSKSHFLTNHAIANDTVIYVCDENASPKDMAHLPLLIDMFAPLNLKWKIHAPTQMDAKTRQQLCTINSNIEIFLSKPLNQIQSTQIINSTLLISDLICTKENMQKQSIFLHILKPRAACLKIKPDYCEPPSSDKQTESSATSSPVDFEYMHGNLYLAPFSSPHSCEYQLEVKAPYTRLQTYNHQHLEQAAAFYNRFVRPKNDCDIHAMHKILDTYCVKVHNANTNRDKLLEACQNFLCHQQRQN
jgi:hypothetical protein